ncbi:MAG: class I SAM-dependent methyltransferase [Isosphaeraceae bacterium]
MNQSSFLSDVCFWLPDHVSHPFGWVGHIPFAFWITEALRPEVLVELGTHSGNSYFAFCQAVKKLGLSTRCHAVDCWEGDEHAGFYGGEIFECVDQTNRREYASFSRLIRARFDEAAPLFEPQSIDLLHIDGLHTYEAVKHDFEYWLPKMSRRGIILMHDTNVYKNDFGVHVLFEEQAKRYPTFQFLHSYGLGVIGAGDKLPEQVLSLFEATGVEPRRDAIRACYERLGQAVFDRAAYAGLEDLKKSLDSELTQARQTQTSMQRQVDALTGEMGSLVNQFSVLNAARQQSGKETAKLQQTLISASLHIETLNRHIEELKEQKSMLAQQELVLEQQSHALEQERFLVDAQKCAMELDLFNLEAERSAHREWQQGATDEIARLRDELLSHHKRICEIQQSLGWMLLDRVRRIRDRMIDSDTTPGRCWAALTGLFKSAAG